MALVINTNVMSLNAQRNLTTSGNQLATALQRLSSGLRINSAKDDAAGLAIANRFTANVRGLTQAARNANDGISLAQTTEGATAEITTHLQRIRELAVQASNGTYSSTDLASMQAEVQQRLDDIDRISQQTDFNGVKVLADNNTLTLQVGARDGETIQVNLKQINVETLGLGNFNIGGPTGDTAALTTASDVFADIAAGSGSLTIYDAGESTTDVTLVKDERGNYYVQDGSDCSADIHGPD